ncbi:MAG: hypothetical protein E7017_07810 [Alphaproteobacteria bacterium]|nr:hypothetical protein [Alphaproteobacteria bacterium]
MLKSYVKEVLISIGAMATVFMFASIINSQIFDINFFRMLIVMGFIITTSNHMFFGLKLVSHNGIINGVLQCSVMILAAIFLPMAFGISEFKIWRIVWTIVVISILYLVAQIIVIKLQKRSLEKINEKLKENEE